MCAPSCFCRRAAIEKIGPFKRGLIQLQDFDYWIRACKKKLEIKLHKDPLLQYRTLFGDNLSGDRNTNRIKFETAALYRSYFEDVPIDLLHQAFGDKITLGAFDSCPDIEIDKSFLLLEHSSQVVKVIGMERMIQLLEDDAVYGKLKAERGFGIKDFFQLTKSNNVDSIKRDGKLKKGLIYIRRKLLYYLRFVFTEGPKWSDAQVKQRIQYYLEQGDHKRALMVLHGYRRFPPGPTIFATLLKVLNKIIVKVGALLKIISTLPVKLFRTMAGNVRIKISAILNPPSIMEDVFLLGRMYDYS